MKKFYSFLFFLLCASAILAQTQNQIDEQNEQAEAKLNQNPQQSLVIATKTRLTAESIGYKKGMAHAIAIMGVANHKIDRYDTAQALLKEAAAIDARTGDSSGLAYCKYWLGNIELNKGRYSTALDLFQEAYLIADKTGDKQNLARSLDGKASIYDALNEDDKALELYHQAMDVARQVNFKAWYPGLILSLGDMDYKKNKFDSAISKYKEAIKLSDETGNINNKANCYQRLSSVYFDKRETKSAMQYIEKAMDLFKQTGSMSSFSYGRLQMCNILLADKEPETAIDLATQSFNEGKETGETELQKDAAEVLYRAELSKGDKGAALDYHVKFHNLSEETHNDELAKKLALIDLGNKFRAEEAKHDLEMKAQIEKQRLIKSVSIVGIFLLAIIAGLAVFAFNQKRKDNALIVKEKNRTDELLLNILPREIVDEIKKSEYKGRSRTTVLFGDLRVLKRQGDGAGSSAVLQPEATTEYYFKKFDEIAAKNKIEKIRTGGDTYLCLGASAEMEKDNALSVVRAALEMQQLIERAKAENWDTSPTIGIGIHTGPLIAGIVGIRKFSSDIWGDTVNIATRMELHGGDGKINISGSTFELVNDKFSCIKHGAVETKKNEKIDMYFIEGAS